MSTGRENGVLGVGTSRNAAEPVIAFAGGGPSAALVAIALLRATTWLRLGYEVVLLDEYGRYARGTSCAGGDDRRLDAPVRTLSAFPDRPAHLLEWARSSGVRCSPATHLPRRVYGDYLAATLADTTDWAWPHAAVHRRSARVAALAADGDGVVLHIRDDRPGRASARTRSAGTGAGPAGEERLRVAAAVVATGDPAVHAPPPIAGVPAQRGAAGLASCPRGALITVSGGPSPCLFVVGPARRGHRFDALPRIRDQAERLAGLIADTVLRRAGTAHRGDPAG
ncbi:putative NAD(P)/FAD-binding protein YdhS [Nocardiopsis mwathae]|uniref:Putative NAD(P)/FAD-binding protein YdhS n=1 Tax=Nocardiopsis mwathae TaxID=1472723 RepID=A0A7X0D4P4_9ACTN|nr:FAD/NAD(P)-binding protein [Nocardiopsis mwathae]MBB6171408.1 putative NAD(P)/FAD-binding protein YdhS [Nocardiopsis mwathae]